MQKESAFEACAGPWIGSQSSNIRAKTPKPHKFSLVEKIMNIYLYKIN